MRYLSLCLLCSIVCLGCVSTSSGNTISSEYDNVSDQIFAYETELKTLLAMENAKRRYRENKITFEEYREKIEKYFDLRYEHRQKGFEVGQPELSENLPEAQFRQNESYILDQLHKLKQQRVEIVKEETGN